MHANGTIIGGMSTAEEMCSVFIGYYPEIDLEACRSEYPRNEILAGFGIENSRGYPFHNIKIIFIDFI